jgi:hypothetical protein
MSLFLFLIRLVELIQQPKRLHSFFYTRNLCRHFKVAVD